MQENLSNPIKNRSERPISLTEASKLFNLSAGHLNLLARTGKIKAIKLGRNWYTYENSVREYLAPKQKPDDNLISLSEASRIFNLSGGHLNLLARTGKIKAIKLGRNWYTYGNSVRMYLEEHKKNLQPQVIIPQEPKEIEKPVEIGVEKPIAIEAREDKESKRGFSRIFRVNTAQLFILIAILLALVIFGLSQTRLFASLDQKFSDLASQFAHFQDSTLSAIRGLSQEFSQNFQNLEKYQKAILSEFVAFKEGPNLGQTTITSKNKPQLSVGYDDLHYMDIAVSPSGQVNLDAQGGGGEFIFLADAKFTEDLTAPNIVYSILGTSNRITSTGGQNPQIDISPNYAGQASINILGTVTTGTWQATPLTTPYIADEAVSEAKLDINNAPVNNFYLRWNNTEGKMEWVSGSGGAPVDSAYVTIGNDPTLQAERALTGTTNQIIVADGGANGNVTLSTPQNIHTGASPTFAGLTLTGLSGVLKATAGAISGSATTSDLPEGSNQYYLDSRTRGALSGTAPINYNSGTGVIGLNYDSTDLGVDGSNNLYVKDSGINHNSLQNYIANEHINHTTVSINASTGLTGGGDISSTRTISLSHLGIESLADPNADRIFFWDESSGPTGASAWLTPNTGLTISGTNLNLADTLVTLGAYGSASQVGAFTVDQQGRLTVASNIAISISSGSITDFIEAAQDATGAMVGSSLQYVDATPLLDTIQDIRNSASPTFAGLTINGDAAFNTPSFAGLTVTRDAGGTGGASIKLVNDDAAGSFSLAIGADEAFHLYDTDLTDRLSVAQDGIVNITGSLGVNIAPSDNAIRSAFTQATNTLSIGTRSIVTATYNAGNFTADIYGNLTEADYTGGQTMTATMRMAQFRSYISGTTGTINTAYGIQAVFRSGASAITATYANAYGFAVGTTQGAGSTLVINNLISFYMPAGLTGTNRFGIYIADTGATNVLTTTTPLADSTYNLGGSDPLYWANIYTDRLYLNSTAYLDGATAGWVNIYPANGVNILDASSPELRLTETSDANTRILQLKVNNTATTVDIVSTFGATGAWPMRLMMVSTAALTIGTSAQVNLGTATTATAAGQLGLNRLYLNSTAYLDGATAGYATLVGGLYFNDSNVAIVEWGTNNLGIKATGGFLYLNYGLAAVFENADNTVADQIYQGSIGYSGNYWDNAYLSRVYLNSTTYLDGATAGTTTIAGETNSAYILSLSDITTGGNYASGLLVNIRYTAGTVRDIINAQSNSIERFTLNATGGASFNPATLEPTTAGQVSMDRLYLNSTAYLDGATAGIVGIGADGIANTELRLYSSTAGAYMDFTTGTANRVLFVGNMPSSIYNSANYDLRLGISGVGNWEIKATTSAWQPTADSTYNIGATAFYVANIFTDRVTLNSTAYLDGATAGQTSVYGNLQIGTPLNTTYNYLQLDTLNADTAGPPASADCDAGSEVGRVTISTRYTATAEYRIWVCTQTGAATYGWKSATLN